MTEPLTDEEWLHKLKELEDISITDVQPPDSAFLTFAVCTDGVDACGWGSWLLEAAFAATGDPRFFRSGSFVVPAVTSQICPRCGKVLFRTLAQHRFNRSTET